MEGGRKGGRKESRMEGKIKVTGKTNIWSFHQYLTSFPQPEMHFWLQLKIKNYFFFPLVECPLSKSEELCF